MKNIWREHHATVALKIQLDITDQDVKKVLIDNGSSADIIFRHALRKMILDGPTEKQDPLNDFEK